MGGFEMELIDEIVSSHKSGKVAFHVAYDRLIKDVGLSEERAYELLVPPLDDDFDMAPPVPPGGWE